MKTLNLAPDPKPTTAAVGLNRSGSQAADARVKGNNQLVVYSTPVYDDGTVGDRQELTFDLLDAGPVAERIGTHILSRAASLIDAPKARLKDERRRCGAVAVTITIDRE
jgi:hypothetical protein